MQRARALEVDRTRVMGEEEVVWLPWRVDLLRDKSDETAEDDTPTDEGGGMLVEVAADVELDDDT